MTASLPPEVQTVFERFITTEYTTVDPAQQPITWPVTPYYSLGASSVDVTTGLGYPKKARDAEQNPQVALLFSDPTGSGLEGSPQVLVQGTARVDAEDLDANRERYARESKAKLPAAESMEPPRPLRRLLGWYYTRLYVQVRPERVYVWPDGDLGREPSLFDAHIEEVRSGHSEEPEEPRDAVAGGGIEWDERIDELGSRYSEAVLSVVAPDGFPFAVRVPVAVDRATRKVRITAEPIGVPLHPGRACLTAHDHAPDFTWQRNFQVRGDLVADESGFALVPHRLVGGFELPPTSTLQRYTLNARKFLRFRRIARRELARRGR